MIGMTQRQREVLDYITAYIAEKSFSPSVGEIAQYFAISPPSALMHLRALQKKKLIRRTSRARSIVLIKQDAPASTSLFCAVPCYLNGTALINGEAVENIFISPDLISSETFQQLFAFRVTDEYPEASGIRKGDLLIARKQSTAADDELILVTLGTTDTITVGRCKRDGKDACMMQYSKCFKDIKIIGRVLALQRTY